MRITVGIPSRNRPAGLLALLTTLDQLAVGFHDVLYAVVMDDEDYVTLEHFEHWKKAGLLPQGVRAFVGERKKTVNARVNDAFSVCPGDVYSVVTDDQFPLTLHWDNIFYGCRQLPAFCWTEATDPGNATFLCTSAKWYGVTGRFMPEYFPFWFADTWLAEVYKLAFGMPISVIDQLRMGHGKRGGTQGMRDLEFWFRFFAATRSERIEEAQKIADAYGVIITVASERADELKRMEEADAWQLTQVPKYELSFKSNLGEPTQVYKAAKARAEAWMESRLEVA